MVLWENQENWKTSSHVDKIKEKTQTTNTQNEREENIAGLKDILKNNKGILGTTYSNKF